MGNKDKYHIPLDQIEMKQFQNLGFEESPNSLKKARQWYMTQENYSLKVSDRSFLEALQRTNLQNQAPEHLLSPKQQLVER